MGTRQRSLQEPDEIAVQARCNPTGFVFTVKNGKGYIGASRMQFAIKELCRNVDAHAEQMRMCAEERDERGFLRARFKRLTQGAVLYLREALADSDPILFSATLVTGTGKVMGVEKAPVPPHELAAAGFANTMATLARRTCNDGISIEIDLTRMQFDQLCRGPAASDTEL